MNRSLLSRIMPFLLLFYVLAFAAFFIYSFITFSAGVYLPSLRWEYALKNAFVLFMDYLIPVHAAAVAVAASLSFDRGAPKPGVQSQQFAGIASSTLVAFLVLTAAYTALAEGVAPAARKRLSDMQYLTRVAGEYRRQAAAAMQAKDYRAALDALNRYLAVEPTDKEVADQRLEAISGAAAQGTPRSTEETGTPAGAGQADAQALVEKARYYEERKDWFSAHYYAQAAVALDPRRVDALRIASEAANELAHSTRSDMDAKTAELFQRKRDALAKLENGDALGAYYSFLAMANENKNDPDVARYLGESQAAVSKAAFFVDDARKVELLPGTQGILFLNRNDGESAEAVSVGKMVDLPGGDVYFFDIEAFRYDASGNVAWHFTARYGRREGDSILMRGVDSRDRAAQSQPLYLEGARSGPERNVLRLAPTVQELRALSSSRTAFAGIGISDMWRLRSRLGAYGLARQSLGVEMTMRLVMPFAFLILSILCTAMGWALRMRSSERPPVVGILLMPLLPVVLALMSLLYLYAHRVIVGFTVIGFGLTVSFIVMAALQLILLAFSLVLLAGQSTR
jgi:tetratricopeptide (TPR) repeat protein